MSDQSPVIPGLVYTQDLIRQAQAAESFVKGEWQRTRRANIGWRAYGALMTFLLILAIGTINTLVPLQRILPVFFWQRADGMIETAITTDSLPADLSDANIQAWLWQYVMHRESYSWVEADWNNHVVQAMSALPVREAYDAWFTGKNKGSPQNTLGHNGVIRVGQREVTQFQAATAEHPGRITFHFDRLIVREGEPRKPAQEWTVTLEFVQDYTRGFTIQDIRQFNPSRIVVTGYPGAMPLPAAPGALAQ